MPLDAETELQSDVKWRCVLPDSLPRLWPNYAPLVQKALAEGEGSYNERDVLCALLAGQWQLWAAYDELPSTWHNKSIVITEIVDFPRQRKCVVRYAAGKLEPMREGIETLETFARENGCHRIEVYGRKGWNRVLSWARKYVILHKDLNDGRQSP